MTDKSKPEELTDADLDDVQGGAYINVEHEVRKGMVLSSESETTYLTGKRDDKGIVLSSEGENPNVKR